MAICWPKYWTLSTELRLLDHSIEAGIGLRALGEQRTPVERNVIGVLVGAMFKDAVHLPDKRAINHSKYLCQAC